MSKWIKADAKAWPLGYSGLDGSDPISIPAGGSALVSDAKAAQLLADFPGAFSEVDAKEAAKVAVPATVKADSGKGKAKPEGA